MEKLVLAVFAICFGLFVGCAFGALMAFPVKWLINGCISQQTIQAVLGVPQLGWLHAWGLLVLCSILLKGGSASASSK